MLARRLSGWEVCSQGEVEPLDSVNVPTKPRGGSEPGKMAQDESRATPGHKIPSLSGKE